MLNKYEFITIPEGELCKIIIYKTCVLNPSSIFMKQNKNQQSFGLIMKHFQSSNAFQFPLNVMDVITHYWMYFIG